MKELCNSNENSFISNVLKVAAF